MMQMHQLVTFVIPFFGFRLEFLGGLFDVGFLFFVALNGLGVMFSFAAGRQLEAQFGQILFAALGLIVIPLIGSFGLLDCGIVLRHTGIGLRCTALIGEQCPHRSE